MTVLAALVGLAHALLLQASPAQLGQLGQLRDTPDSGGNTFATRRIAAPVAVATPAPQIAPKTAAAPSAPKAVKTSQKSQDGQIVQKIQPAQTVQTVQPPPISEENQPPAQQFQAPVAPEIIATAEPVASQPAAPDIPTNTAAAVTPSQEVTATAPAPGPSATVVTAITLPGSVRLQYKVFGLSKNLNYQASAELSWKTDGATYDAMLKVSAFLVGSRSMTSVGKITGSGLTPTRFADKFKTELAAHFEADKGKIVFSANTPDAVWIDGVQDRVSVFLQLAGMLAANPAGFPPGSNVTFLTIGPREADNWTFIVEAEESLNLMNAPMAALKLTRKPRKEFDQKVEIWFAPSLGYLPVRSRITQHGGDFIDQQLTEIVK